MQVSVETTTGLERKVTLGIPAEQIDSEVEKRVADTARKARLDGFRAGKVPKKVIRQRFGDSIRGEVLGEVINSSFQQALSQESLNPVGQPQIDILKNEAGQDLEVEAIFEIFPEIELADASVLEIEKPVAEVTDENVQTMIAKLREQNATYTEVERAAADKDKLNIDFVGKVDDEEFAGGSAEGHDLVLGSGAMIDGFETGLVGAKVGDKISLDVTFPEDYGNEELQGKPAKFEVTVNTVSEAELPALDEAFFKQFEVEGDLAAFEAKVRENMDKQLTDTVKGSIKQQVMDGLYEINKFDLPAAMIKQEIDAMRQQSIQQFGGAAENFDSSILPDEMFSEQAERRCALGVIMSKAVPTYEIKPEREQIMAFIDDVAQSYDDPDQVKSMYMSDENMLQQVQLLVSEDLVVEKVLEMAKVTEANQSYDDVIKAAAAR